MKKIVCLFIAAAVFFSVSVGCLSAKTSDWKTRFVNCEMESDVLCKNFEDLDSDVFSITMTFDSFDDAKDAGDTLFYESDDFSGYLFLERADRIGNSSKFTAVYTNRQ